MVEKSNAYCMEALMYRYHPLTKKLQELINNNVLGEIKLFNATYMANIATLANPIFQNIIMKYRGKIVSEILKY